MILDIWKPKYNNIDKKRVITKYFLITMGELIIKKYKNCKVTYMCDRCESNKIHKTTSHSLFTSKYNNIKSQTCKECRSRISEYEIRKNYIKFDEILNDIIKEDYKVLSNRKQYMMSGHRSQFKINVICSKGHKYHITWNNWRRGKRCRECYEENKYSEAIKYKEGFDLYMFEVGRLTEINYKKYKKLINPNGYKRGKFSYHIDHVFSKYEGFKNNIDPEIISSHINLNMVKSDYNLTKGKKSDIDLETLLERYNDFYLSE